MQGEGAEAEGERTWKWQCASAELGCCGFDVKRQRRWVLSVPSTHGLRLILELVIGVKLVRGWGNSLGKKWISCLLSINIPTTATNHKTAEGPIK